MLRREDLREFDVIASKVSSTTQCTPKTDQGGFTKLLFSHQPTQQEEARHEARNEETLISPVQDICSKTNIIK